MTLADIAELDGVLAANIAKVNGLVFTTAPGAFLLDTYTGAAAAYSTRKLKTGVTVAARIRRSGDDIEADVEFDSNNEISLTSPISNASSGTYTDLADFVDHTGTARDAFIDEWKDQSGSGNHAAQATFGSQPKLYDATTGLITENGKPALDFDGTDDQLQSTSNIAIDMSAYSAMTVLTADSTSNMLGVKQLFGSNRRIYLSLINSGNYYVSWRTSTAANYGTADTDQYLVSVYAGSTSVNAYRNGVVKTLQTDTYTTNQALSIGAFSVANNSWDGTIQEVIVYESDQSSNRTGIESDINGYFSIYT